MSYVREILISTLQTFIGTAIGLMVAVFLFEIVNRADVRIGVLEYILWIGSIIIGSLSAGFSNMRREIKIWPAILAAVILFPGSFLSLLVYGCHFYDRCP